MVALTKRQTLALSAVPVLPAVFIVVGGVLDIAFNIEGPDRLFGWLNRNPLGAILFDPPIVIAGAGAAILLNVSRFCRIWFGPERGTINLSVSLAGSTPYLVTASLASASAAVLMLYGAKYAIRAALRELLG